MDTQAFLVLHFAWNFKFLFLRVQAAAGCIWEAE